MTLAPVRWAGLWCSKAFGIRSSGVEVQGIGSGFGEAGLRGALWEQVRTSEPEVAMGRRHAIVGCVVGAAVWLAGVPAAAVPLDPAGAVVVHPSGSYPADVEAVQTAVDVGGTVVLESVDVAGNPTGFDFGPVDAGGGVELTEDVVILGSRGRHPTRIEGGTIPFFGTAATRTRIEGIIFDGAGLSAAIFTRSSGVEFVDNYVTGVVGLELIFPFVATEGRGIKFLGNNDPAGAITGNILVAGNRFDDMHADLAEAIVFDSVAADATIVDNVIEDVAGGGVLALFGSGDLAITGNTITPGPGDGGDFQFGNGVQILGGGGAYQVTRNLIDCENPLADPVLLAGQVEFGWGAIDAPTITHNHISTASTDFGGITLFGDVNDAYVANNRLGGTALYGLGVVPLFSATEKATGNRFIGNSVTGLNATLADTLIFSHAFDTAIVGNAGSVIDFGHDSVITGDRPIQGDLREVPGRSDAVQATASFRGGAYK